MPKQIPSELIQPGIRLPGALCDKAGRVLIPAGTELTETDIAKLGGRLITGLYGGDDWPDDSHREAENPGDQQEARPVSAAETALEPSEPPDAPLESESRDVNVDVLRLGMHLYHDIFDQAGVLLLAAVSQVTSRFLLLLRQRDIRTVRLLPPHRQQQAAVSEAPQAQQVDALLSAELKKQPPLGLAAGPSKRPHDAVKELLADGRCGRLDRTAPSLPQA